MEIENYRNLEPKLELAKKLKTVVWIVSIAVLGLVASMRYIPKPEGIDLFFLPPFHAFLNTLAAISLLLAVWYVKKGRVSLHRKWIYFAVFCSLVFLLSYVVYHFTTPETKYGDLNGDRLLSDTEIVEAGNGRTIYLWLLLSHISLAALSFPFILMTFVLGYTNQFAKHKKMARIIFPVWLYVAITGPVVYLLLRPFY